MLIQNEDMQEFIQDHSREDGGKKKIADATKQGYVMFRSRKKKEKRERERENVRKRSQPGFLCLLLRYLEKRSADQGWKKRYFVLKGVSSLGQSLEHCDMRATYFVFFFPMKKDQKKLYYFESDSAAKVKGVIDLSKSQVHSLDESYFQKKVLDR